MEKVYWLMRNFLIVLFFFTAACSSEKKEEKDFFFSLEKFYSSEVSRLDSQQINLTKIACLNGKCDTLLNPDINWKEEISIIAGADINKAAWKDSYHVANDGNKTIYTCTDSSLSIKSISFVRENEKIQTLHFTKQVQNKIYMSSQELTYIPDTRLFIKGRMSVLESISTDYTIEYIFN